MTCALSLASALTVNQPSIEDVKRNALRKLADAVEAGAINTTEEEMPTHDDLGPGWPEPGPESYKITAQILKEAAANGGNRADFPRIVQPVSFINFVMKDGTGRVSYSAMQKQIDQLNAAYSGQEARDGGYSKPTDSNIRFKLAGVRYVVNDDFFNLCTLPSYIVQYRPKYMMNGARHLNIYVCWDQNNLGNAWLPYDSWYGQNTDENHYALGAIVHWNLLPGNTFKGGLWSKGNIATHEVGHCFGLRHPYEGDCYGSETNSDQIDDTPRMTGNPLSTCAAVRNRDSCPTLAGSDDMQNYMVATADTCRNHFTPGQVDYMQIMIRAYKPTLMKQLPPSCVAAIDSTDNSPDLQPCLEGTLKTNTNGQQWCQTDPDDKTVWAWACCPSSMDWDSQDCWRGTPDFGLPSPAVARPGSSPSTLPIPSSTTRPTKSPIKSTSSPNTPGGTPYPTKRPTSYPTGSPTLRPSRNPTRTPTRRPTRRRRVRRAVKRGLTAEEAED